MAYRAKADDIGVNIKTVLELLLMAQRNYMMAFHVRVICIVYDECLMMMIDFAKVVFCFKDLMLNNRGSSVPFAGYLIVIFFSWYGLVKF
mgnify:FL=1